MTSEAMIGVPAFLSYLQKRMDFIAQVATSAPSWCLVTSCDDLIDSFNKQYCLVKNIIRSHQGARDGVSFEPYFNKRYDTPKSGAPDISIPHGQIGGQAFYTILENIVRNTAKYGDPKQLDAIKDVPGSGRLEFTITVKDAWDKTNTGWVKDFYQVQIIDHLLTEDHQHPDEDVVAKLNGFLSQPLTDAATGVVMPKHWGMKEIKICAAYLRMVKQDQIDDKFEKWNKGLEVGQPPIIRASLENARPVQGKRKGNLTYTLYLLRPKTALVVLPPVRETESFRQAGVEFWSKTEFQRRIEQGESPRHDFLVVPKPANYTEWNWLADNLNRFSPRVIVLDCNEDAVPPIKHQGQLKRTLAFMPTPPLRTPALLLDTLRKCWVDRWWGDFEVYARWFRFKDTVAERGDPEETDEWPALPPDAPSRWLVFDHKSDADRTTLYRTAAYHESIYFGSPTAEMLEKRGQAHGINGVHLTTEMVERQRRLRLKEMAALSVAVIDERVWLEKDGLAPSGVKKYSKRATSRYDVWRKRRVYMQDTNEALRDFGKFVDSLTPPRGRYLFDFLIIHQGIIDGVKDRMGGKFEERWTSLRRKARWLVVDSGRGQPEQARADDLRWVEYSNLAECLIQYAGDKMRLVELLWTLRASSRNGVSG
jgi:hypothetical protein